MLKSMNQQPVHPHYKIYRIDDGGMNLRVQSKKTITKNYENHSALKKLFNCKNLIDKSLSKQRNKKKNKSKHYSKMNNIFSSTLAACEVKSSEEIEMKSLS